MASKGWSRKKRLAVEAAFYEFLNRCYVNSKDAGRICLGQNLYDGQKRAITAVFDALEKDIHKIYVLKSRQLGISTIIRALIIFMLGVHSGLKGAIVFDTDSNKQESRAELEVMIYELPASLKFPAVASSNRAGLSLENNSKVLFMSAGTQKRKTSGVLGRSVGLSLAHLSELCSYDNDEGMEAFEQSLSEEHPDRLYIYESTARGFNKWWQRWCEARKDPLHCVCVFLGWWSKPNQKIDRDSVDWAVYGEQPPTALEEAKIRIVKEQYDHDVTPEQLAWVRRKMDPTAQREGDAPAEFIGDPLRIGEQPWTEEEAFQQSGSIFFPPQALTDLTNKWVSRKFKTYMFIAGAEFADMRIYPAASSHQVELKVWEEPDPNGSYVLAVDPAYGTNAKNARSSIQVFRCYSDGVDQVAEYAWPLVTTYQLAWVIASLMGWYGTPPEDENGRARGNPEIRYILELNGPGAAVWNELRSLRFKLENMQIPIIEDKGLKNIFQNVRTYMYSRPDSMTAASNYHFTTTDTLKVTLLERLRDFVTTGIIRVRSMDLIGEMRSIARDEKSISAPDGLCDDRVLAAALGVHCWEEKVRRGLIASKRSRESEEARRHLSILNQVELFNQNNLTSFFKIKQKARQSELALMQRRNWRYGSRRYR